MYSTLKLVVFLVAPAAAFQLPSIDLSDGPPVSPACASAAGKIDGDAAVTAAGNKVTGADQTAATQAAYAACKNEIVSKLTCHTTVDWSPYESDVDAAVAAVQKVESTAKLCFLDFNFTRKIDVGEFKVFVKKATAGPVSASCTTADRNIYLAFIQNQTLSNPNLTDLVAGWNDPTCATPGTL
jgi:hypothetical protein